MFRTIEISDPALAPDGLQFVTVKSAALGMRADLSLYVPSQAAGLRDVPMAILLHGVYGSHWAWAFKGGAHVTAARLIEAGEIPPMVLAMPSDGLWGDGSGYVAHEAHGGKAAQNFERWIVEEVPAAVLAANSSTSGQSKIFIAGLSMGGWGALRLAVKYPTRFAAASAHSSVTDASQFEGLIAESCTHWSQAPADASVLAALTQSTGPLPPLRLDCGTEDFLLAHNRVLHQDLLHAGIAHRYDEYPGGHEWPYWQRNLEHSLRFFAAQL
jgi:S-formylglutathione hydrolase FrmB